MSAVVVLGFVKDAKHHVDVQGFNVYHKNRLIKVINIDTMPLLDFIYSHVLVSLTCFISRFGGYGMQQAVMVVES